MANVVREITYSLLFICMKHIQATNCEISSSQSEIERGALTKIGNGNRFITVHARRVIG